MEDPGVFVTAAAMDLETAEKLAMEDPGVFVTAAAMDLETAEKLSVDSRAVKRDYRHGEHCETKRMKAADDRSKLVEAAAAAVAAAAAAALAEAATLAEAAAAAAAESTAPQPRSKSLFATGQSVLNWWAPWFKDCGPGQHPKTYAKKKRPLWYNSEIASEIGWRDDVPYAGALMSGYMYLVY